MQVEGAVEESLRDKGTISLSRYEGINVADIWPARIAKDPHRVFICARCPELEQSRTVPRERASAASRKPHLDRECFRA